MIQKIEIQNFKSIEHLEVEIGRFNVFIGENGCGKSNLLEAIAFASSANDAGKLSLKGVRPTEPRYFRNGFNQNSSINNISVCFQDNISKKIIFDWSNSNSVYSKWELNMPTNENDDFGFLNSINRVNNVLYFTNFILYAPENYFLRNYNIESPYEQPLGCKGEGLLKLVKIIKQENPDEYNEIIENLYLIDWFSNIEISDDSFSGAEFKLTDKYLEEGIGGFDIKNANEGFFLLLFYVTLFVSDYTPKFFAIDNIDTALNPKLCTKMIEILAALAKKHDKQVLITTHNPSILDGINLNDSEQRLFAVSRNKTGYTRVNRIEKKPPLDGEKSLRLSEQFLRGYIGGIPKNF